MYQIGDLVIYGGQGVCRVEKIGFLNIIGINKDRLYYTLSPFYHDGKIYTPVDTDIYMRPIITYDEAQYLIKMIPETRTDVYENRNVRMLSEHYQAWLTTYDCADLIELIKTVYTKREIVTERGKELGQTDKKYMKRAEELLHGELAVALGIPKDHVKCYIEETVKKLKSA